MKQPRVDNGNAASSYTMVTLRVVLLGGIFGMVLMTLMQGTVVTIVIHNGSQDQRMATVQERTYAQGFDRSKLLSGSAVLIGSVSEEAVSAITSAASASRLRTTDRGSHNKLISEPVEQPQMTTEKVVAVPDEKPTRRPTPQKEQEVVKQVVRKETVPPAVKQNITKPVLRQQEAVQIKAVSNANESAVKKATLKSTTKAPTDNRRPCRIMLENTYDFHYEVIEGTGLRYPALWKNAANCSMDKPVLIDVALTWSDRKGEMDGWTKYFNRTLKGKTFPRSDGTKATFRGIVPWKYYKKYDKPALYDAIIGISCDFRDPKEFVDQSNNHYCVMHQGCGSEDMCNERVRQRSCWVSPMHKECFFLPIDLPQFPRSKCFPESDQKINVCVSGKARPHYELAPALAKLSEEYKDSIQLSIFKRTPEIPDPYVKEKVDSMVQIVRESGYLEFQHEMSKCDVILPLINPAHSHSLEYFPEPRGLGRLSGCLSQAMGYKIPMVMHEELYGIYKDHLTAPVVTYTDLDSFDVAFPKMIAQMKERTKDQC